MLRTKTLLGETYVELTPGSNGEPALEDGGELPAAPEPATPNKAGNPIYFLVTTSS
jgi:ABC-type transporter Mla subunit MlaD